MAQQDDIQTHEAYRRGLLTEAERLAWEDRLHNEPALATDLAGYDTLWQGLTQLAEQDLRQRFAEWSTDWSEDDDIELVEWYLTGRLNETATQRFDERVATDTAFAEKVDRQRALLAGLDQLQSDTFVGKLRSWEAATPADDVPALAATTGPTPPPSTARVRTINWRRWSAAAAVLFLVFVGLHFLVGGQYEDAVLAENAYVAPQADQTMGADDEVVDALPATFVEEFGRAHRLFQQGDYGAARAAFARLRTDLPGVGMDDFTRSYYQENLEWNEVLAALAAGQYDDTYADLLAAVAQTSGHLYQQEAQQLQQQLRSVWRNI